MPRSRVSAHNYNVASLHSDKVRDQKGRTWAWPWSIRMFGRVLSRLNAFSTSRAFARNNAAASPRVRTVSTANGYDEVCNRVSALHKCYCGHRIFILRSFVPFYNYMCVCVCVFFMRFLILAFDGNGSPWNGGDLCCSIRTSVFDSLEPTKTRQRVTVLHGTATSPQILFILWVWLFIS